MGDVVNIVRPKKSKDRIIRWLIWHRFDVEKLDTFDIHRELGISEDVVYNTLADIREERRKARVG